MSNSLFDWPESVTRFVRFDGVRANDVNGALDAVSSAFDTVEIRENAAIKLPDGETATALGAAAVRKGKMLSFNATTGAPEAVYATADVETVAGIAADVQAVADVAADVATCASNIADIQNASSNASSAASSASSASTYADAAAASYDAFDDRYLGSKATNPTLDNDGNALLTGALYWNSSVGEMRAYSGSAWAAAYLPESSYVLQSELKTVSGQSLIGTGDISATPSVSVETETSVTGVANTHHVLTSTATNVSLPAGSGLADGDMIWVTVANGLTTNTVTPDAADSINGTTAGEAMTIDNAYATVQLRWIDSTRDWRIV